MGGIWFSKTCSRVHSSRGYRQLNHSEKSVNNIEAMTSISLEHKFEVIEKSHANAVKTIEMNSSALVDAGSLGGQ